MDVVADYRARRLRARGRSYRQIAETSGTSLTGVRRALAAAPAGKARRELRREIRRAGGLQRWWRARG
jgi:hypothetical protein